MSRKLLVTDSRGEHELLLVGKMVVGRDPACDVSDADPLLSRRHAEFVVGTRDVLVRDLGSRNGILVNGIKVGESTLRPDDVVQIGHLQLRYVEDGTPLAAAPEGGLDDGDATAVIQHQSASRAASPTAGPDGLGPALSAAPATAPDVDDDKTRLLKPHVASGAPDRMTQTSGSADSAAPPTAPQRDDADKTRLVAPPSFRPPAPRSAPVRLAVAEVKAPVQPVAVRPARVERTEPKARVSRRSWALVVNTHVAMLAAIAFLATSIPLILWRAGAVDAGALSHASALVDWLAADAAAALQTDAPIAAAADAVAKEPGVVTAYVLASDGRVLAPASQAAETIATLPALGVKPGDVQRLQSAQNGDVIEVARPVPGKDRPRAAVAWITFRPPVSSDAASGAVVLAFPLIIVLVLTFFIATRIGRRTMSGLQALSEDIELAVGGKLDTIGDPFGAKPVQELSRAINFLIARLRLATGGRAVAPARGVDGAPAPAAQSRPVAVPASTAPARVQPAVAAPRIALEARIIASAELRVIEATGSFDDLMGVRPDTLVGGHLIDAIPDREVGDAVMRCLGALGSGGEQRTSVTPAGRPFTLSISMTRAGKDQPINITFRAEEEK